MAYHAGAELANLECFQINPLIKDYNGPACAYVTGPFGGYTSNSNGERFIECDYWSGQMMQEFYNELQSGNGPVFLKLDHLAEETIQNIETILHTNERPSRGRFHERRGNDYRREMVEMHISEIGFCSGHSASGVWVNERGETTVRVCTPPATWRACRTTTCSARSSTASIAGENAAAYCARGRASAGRTTMRCAAEAARIAAPLQRGEGHPAVPGRIQDAAPGQRLPAAAEGHAQDADRRCARFAEIREDLQHMSREQPARADARDGSAFDPRLRGDGGACIAVPHREPLGAVPPLRRLPRARRRELVLPHAADVATMTAASRCARRPVEPYIVPVDDEERTAYQRLRVARTAEAA